MAVRRTRKTAPSVRRRGTSRRREDPLRELRRVLETVPFPAWMCDDAGRMTYLNPPFRTAVADREQSSPARLWDTVVDPGDLEYWRQTFLAAAAVHSSFRVEVRAGDPAGHRWYLMKGNPHASGTKGYWGTATDITAGKNHEDAARSTEERFKTLADLLGRSAIGLDLDLCVRSWNNAAAERTGIPATTAVGRALHDLPPPLGDPSVGESCRRALRDRSVILLEADGIAGEMPLAIHPFRSGVMVVEQPPAGGEARPEAMSAQAVFRHDMLHNFLRATDDIIVVQDPGGTYVYCNAPDAWGIAEHDVAGRKPHEIFPRELAEKIIRRVRTVCHERTGLEDDTAIEWRGKRHWFHEHLSPIKDERGNVTGVVSIARDVTAQKEIEARLSESEERYRTFMAHSLEGIWELQPGSPVRMDEPVEQLTATLGDRLLIRDCNDAAARIFGFTRREELIGTALSGCLQPDPQARHDFLRSLVASGFRMNGVEVKIVDRSGQVHYVVYALAGTIADGCLQGMWGSVTEVTQRKQADREMRLLAQTITCAQDCVSITDLQNTILFVNDAFLRTYGYSDQDELTGRNIAVVREVQPLMSDQDEIRARTFAGGWNGEITNRRKDGSIFPVELWTSVVKGEDGAPVAMVGVARDITERRRAEEQIRNSLHEKEVMLKEIHHRVKNNLQIVSSLLSLQSEYIVDKAILSLFQESQNRVKSMALIHEKLYQSTNLASVEFDGYLRELSQHLVRSSASETGTIDVRMETRPVTLTIDKAIPCGIIVNELVTNTLKYAFPGRRGGTLYIGCHTDGNGRVCVVVGDNGVGLPPALDPDTADSLGLTLVRMLCDQLQARLVVHREAILLGEPSGVEFEILFAPGIGPQRPESARQT